MVFTDIQLDGVISVHELHVWQLNDTKLIASLHVLLKSREGYMSLGSEIRKVLHSYGIHSATIQPEFVEDQIDEKYEHEELVEESPIVYSVEKPAGEVKITNNNLQPASC